MAGQTLERQQQLLLQDRLAAIFPAELAHPLGDGGTVERLTDARTAGVVAAHHQLAVAGEQIIEGILEMRVHQPQQPSAAAHRLPITRLQAASIDGLHHLGHGYWQGLIRRLQLGGSTQAQLQLLQQFRLLPQGGAAPELGSQIKGSGGFQLQFLLSVNRERAVATGLGQLQWDRRQWHSRRQGRQHHGLADGGRLVIGQGAQLHLHTPQRSRGQAAGQLQHLLTAARKRCRSNRHQQQRLAIGQPMALQQPQLPQQGISQLLRVIGQIEGALLEHGGQERRQLLTAAVEPGHRQGGGGALRRPAQPQALAAPQWGQRLGQPMGRLNGHIAIAWADDRQAFTA